MWLTLSEDWMGSGVRGSMEGVGGGERVGTWVAMFKNILRKIIKQRKQ